MPGTVRPLRPRHLQIITELTDWQLIHQRRFFNHLFRATHYSTIQFALFTVIWIFIYSGDLAQLLQFHLFIVLLKGIFSFCTLLFQGQMIPEALWFDFAVYCSQVSMLQMMFVVTFVFFFE